MIAPYLIVFSSHPLLLHYRQTLLVLIMNKSKTITALPAWEASAESHSDTACIIEGWELVNIELDGDESRFLLGTVVSDYKGRWAAGDYVFTSMIMEMDLDNGHVQTRNSSYCLLGDGLEVFPTLEEAAKMKMTGQPLKAIRDIEQNGFKIMTDDF